MKKRLGRWRPLIIGGVWGLLLSSGMFLQPVSAAAQWSLAVGLFLSYLSIGALVMLIPLMGSRWLFGLLIGLGYSLPGAVFTMAPYPLREDAPLVWSQFASGGLFSFFMTLGVGGVVGVLCALPKEAKPGPVDVASQTLKEHLLPDSEPPAARVTEEKRQPDDA
ncbi:MAG: hypothetical protein AAGK14_08090 [Verrucomicrobiota bacterium]